MTKEEKELEVARMLNQQAVERYKQEVASQSVQENIFYQANQSEAIFFEDDVEIMLRDGKKYRIPPCTLKDARRLMNLLKEIQPDLIIANFLPTGDEEEDNKRIDSLYEVLLIAFKKYPHVTREYLEEYVDIGLAKKIIEILIGLNGLKK
ncbi:MAG: hypothetical protein QXI16_02730 [Sulfolobaceae archaeon]